MGRLRDLARLYAGGIYRVAREFLNEGRAGFRGFWTYLRYRFGLDTAEAVDLARIGAAGVRAADGLGSSSGPNGEGGAWAAPVNTHTGFDPDSPDRLRYAVDVRFRRAFDNTIQNRRVNVTSDLPLTNQDILAELQARLIELTLGRRDYPEFSSEDDEILEWEVRFVEWFREPPF